MPQISQSARYFPPPHDVTVVGFCEKFLHEVQGLIIGKV